MTNARTLATIVIALAAFSAGAFAHASFDVQGSPAERPTVAAARVPDDSVRLDGRLDEDAWETAELAGGFLQHDPERGSPASERTTFKVLYDDDAVYFGVACFERDPSVTSSALSRRDAIGNSDLVSVYIDPYHDRTTGYNFRVNPEGVLADMTVFADGRRDPDWDAVWDAAVHRDATGWFVEMRIPFSAIRFQPGDDLTWGLQVYRWMHGRGEDTGWATWERDVPGFVSRWGTLTGLSGLKASRQLEITPYLVGGLTDHAAEGDDALQSTWNMGADIKYGITANMTLQATIQPDFGQVEADPSLLNLSPFETFYSEKRPFFVEGSRFFEHPAFNLFYSRRIGTGQENSRIRFAGKLIGKTAGDISIAALAAATDITEEGEAWNALKSGHHQARYGVLRLGKESADGDHRIHVMQTAVVRDATVWDDDDDTRQHRDGYATGLDFELNFLDRRYEVAGSLVRTHVKPHDELIAEGLAQGDRIGSGGFLSLGKVGGNWRFGANGLWESDRLDPNDAGRLSAPDEINAELWATYSFDSDGRNSWLKNGSIHVEYDEEWLYAGSTVHDPANPDQVLWTYDPRLHSRRSSDVGFNMSNRDFWSFWGGLWVGSESVSKYATRTYDDQRGPLLRSPAGWSSWWGVRSDWRRDLSWTARLNLNRDDAGGHYTRLGFELQWRQGEHLTHGLEFAFSDNLEDAQWIDNYAGDGIGGVDYVFARLDQQTWDLTWRSSILFDRNSSLELYLQPFLTVGDYSDARALARPDSYEFTAYEADGFVLTYRDFRYAAMNLNLVYRWEYRPGSTFFVVWSHSRNRYDERGDWNGPDRFRNDFDTSLFFGQEPENMFLTKLTYWFSI